MNVMVLMASERGNTNEGVEVQFYDRQVENVEEIADQLDWGVDDVLAVGFRSLAGGWTLMSQTEYVAVLEARTKQSAEKDVPTAVSNLVAEASTTDWHEGDTVSIVLSEGKGDESYAIGFIRGIDGDTATVVEIHAFHSLWGGSNAERGRLHHVKLSHLRPCPAPYRHIVKEYKEKHGA